MMREKISKFFTENPRAKAAAYLAIGILVLIAVFG